MTTTGKLLIETSNDDAFAVGHTYSITLTVSQKIDAFGITDVTPSEIVDESSETSTEKSGETSTGESGESTPNDKSTPPATP